MIDKAIIKVLDFRDNPGNRKYLSLMMILLVLFFLFVIFKVAKVVLKKRKKTIGENEKKLAEAAPEVIKEKEIKSITDLTEEDKKELFLSYKKLMISNFPDYTDVHLVTLAKASVFPLANMDGTLYKAKFKNQSNGKSLVVSLDIHGIYNKDKNGKPYYHIKDEERGASYEVDYDKEKIESFISERLGLEELVEGLPIGETEENAPLDDTPLDADLTEMMMGKFINADKPLDRSPLDDYLLKMNKDRKPDADADLTRIKGISDKRSAEINKAGIFYVEDLHNLPDDCIPILEKLLDGIWGKQIIKWRTHSQELKESS